jgi:hypothetical protein
MTQAVICDQGVIDGDDVIAVSYLEPEHEWDSGFMLFSRPHDATGGGGGLIHLDCVLDMPNVAAGMQLAREHGEATRHGNNWHPQGRRGHQRGPNIAGHPRYVLFPPEWFLGRNPEARETWSRILLLGAPGCSCLGLAERTAGLRGAQGAASMAHAATRPRGETSGPR